MFRAGDPLNPYDPACLDIPNDPVEFMRRLREGQKMLAATYNDPEKRAEYEQYLIDSAEERARTGETQLELMLREKREWAAADAKSAKLKIQGNEAFQNGDYKTAYAVYTACIRLSGHDPLYPLNRAAVALKLRLYETAIADATAALTIEGGFAHAKAHFRRGQGWCFLGEWAKADDEYTAALMLQPGDRNILREVEELKKLRDLPSDAQASARAQVKLEDIFEPDDMKRCVEVVAGNSLD